MDDGGGMMIVACHIRKTKSKALRHEKYINFNITVPFPFNCTHFLIYVL